MSISMHSVSVPVFVRMLRNLSAMLGKAEAHAQERKFARDLLGRHLAPAHNVLNNVIAEQADDVGRVGGD